MKKALYLFLTIFLGNIVNAMEQPNALTLMDLPNDILNIIALNLISKKEFDNPQDYTALDKSIEKLNNSKLICKKINDIINTMITEPQQLNNHFSNINQTLSLKENYVWKKRKLAIKEILIKEFTCSVDQLTFMDDYSKSTKEIIDGILKIKDRYGWNVLNLTSHYGYLEIVKLLLKNGAPIDILNNYDDTPLHLASANDQPEIVELLLKYGAPIDITNKTGRTPLHKASRYGYYAVVKLLLEYGAPIDIKDNDGNTPLHYASRNGYHEVVKLLLEYGAPIDIKDEFGDTPLHLASINNQPEVVKRLENAAEEKKTKEKNAQAQYNTVIKVLSQKSDTRSKQTLWKYSLPAVIQDSYLLPFKKQTAKTDFDSIDNEKAKSRIWQFNPFKSKYIALSLALPAIGYAIYKYFNH
ncbi:MAG: ankyrin repeat domain-containing protein [Candidatus Babeliales bacterium]